MMDIHLVIILYMPFIRICRYAASRYVLTVGSVDTQGRHPYYSEPCSAILVSAPSSSSSREGIITTGILFVSFINQTNCVSDMNLGCSSEFTGTSASAPLVAGVVALMLEVNPNLTWRDVHRIL